jgi:hypothetical protein
MVAEKRLADLILILYGWISSLGNLMQQGML